MLSKLKGLERNIGGRRVENKQCFKGLPLEFSPGLFR
jgi:hypothetical protein